MARATKEVKQELADWVENKMSEEDRVKDLENRLWKLSCCALTELVRQNNEAEMSFFSKGRSIPYYMIHYFLRVKFEIKDRKEKKTWTLNDKL